MTTDNEPVYTVREVAMRLGLGVAQVRQLMEDHKLVAEKRDGVTYVTADSLYRFEQDWRQA